jgi:hypothetical protein
LAHPAEPIVTNQPNVHASHLRGDWTADFYIAPPVLAHLDSEDEGLRDIGRLIVGRRFRAACIEKYGTELIYLFRWDDITMELLPQEA